jgi:hypothetical protein
MLTESKGLRPKRLGRSPLEKSLSASRSKTCCTSGGKAAKPFLLTHTNPSSATFFDLIRIG